MALVKLRGTDIFTVHCCSHSLSRHGYLVMSTVRTSNLFLSEKASTSQPPSTSQVADCSDEECDECDLNSRRAITFTARLPIIQPHWPLLDATTDWLIIYNSRAEPVAVRLSSVHRVVAHGNPFAVRNLRPESRWKGSVGYDHDWTVRGHDLGALRERRETWSALPTKRQARHLHSSAPSVLTIGVTTISSNPRLPQRKRRPL